MTTETDTQAKTAKPPLNKIKIGLVTASIWEKQGEKGPFYTVSFERRYRNEKGEWKTSYTYDAADLAELRVAADVAHGRLIELYNAKR